MKKFKEFIQGTILSQEEWEEEVKKEESPW